MRCTTTISLVVPRRDCHKKAAGEELGIMSPNHWLGAAIIALSVGVVASAQPAGAARPSLSKQPRFTLGDYKDVVWCVAFSPDGKLLVTASGNRYALAGDVRGYDLTTGKPDQRFLAEEPHGIRWVSFAPDGKTLATAEYDGMVEIPGCRDWQGPDQNRSPPRGCTVPQVHPRRQDAGDVWQGLHVQNLGPRHQKGHGDDAWSEQPCLLA